MGLIKEALEAVIRIDRNLAAIRRAVANTDNDALYRAIYQQKPIKAKGSTFDRVIREKDFCYPDSLTFGGRLRAVRMYEHLKQEELAAEIGVTPPHISNLEADKSTPSAMFIRSVSRRYNIDEHWLATGHLPQTTEEPATPIHLGKIVPLSGYGDAEALQSHINLQHQTRLEVQESLGIQEDSR